MSQEEDQQEVPGTSEQAEQLWSLQEAHEALESERNELNIKVQSLEAELAAAETECQESETTIEALREENNDLLNANKTLEHPDTIALLFLENNCLNYTINRDIKTGAIVLSGTLQGPQAGYVTRYVPRVFRANGKAPYLIHPEDTYKHYRTVQFKYSAVGEDLAQAVEGLILSYCPGDVEVEAQAFEDNRYCDYGDGEHVWVQCATEETLEEVQKFKEVGEDPDLNNPDVRKTKVPGQ